MGGPGGLLRERKKSGWEAIFYLTFVVTVYILVIGLGRVRRGKVRWGAVRCGGVRYGEARIFL